MKVRSTDVPIVAVSGGFDPIHIGHVRHIEKAASLITPHWLVAIVNPDIDMIVKKGYVFMPVSERMEIVGALKWVDEVVPAIDCDGTVAKTLRQLMPAIFAKGGDRTPQNMPINEITTCKDIGCRIVYGIGEQLRSSSAFVNKIKK